VELFSRNGSRFSRRFPRLVSVLRELPAESVILDGEIVGSGALACPTSGDYSCAQLSQVNFIYGRSKILNCKDLRKWSLEARQGRLQTLVSRFDSPVLLFPKRSMTARRCSAWRRSTGWRRGEQSPRCAL
jgi:hypothetical protein